VAPDSAQYQTLRRKGLGKQRVLPACLQSLDSPQRFLLGKVNSPSGNVKLCQCFINLSTADFVGKGMKQLSSPG
jgi:hypothetical protein